MGKTSSKVRHDPQILEEAQVVLDVLNYQSSKEKERLTYDEYHS